MYLHLKTVTGVQGTGIYIYIILIFDEFSETNESVQLWIICMEKAKSGKIEKHNYDRPK